MDRFESAVSLRIFIAENEKYQGKPVYEAIVLKAKSFGIKGATVTRAIMGFGADRDIHSSKILRLSDDMPLVIEIVDTKEKIFELLPFVEEAAQEGLITVEDVRIVKYSGET